MDLTTGTILIFSGEGDEGTWERYEGARTVKAIRNRLTRERAHGDRWASAWIEEPTLEDAGYPGVPVYCEIDRDFQGVGRTRAVTADMIRVNPAAQLRAGKPNPASAENGKRGGRPRYEVRHYFTNPGNNETVKCGTTDEAKAVLRTYDGEEPGNCSKLYKNGEVIAWREHNQKNIHWM